MNKTRRVLTKLHGVLKQNMFLIVFSSVVFVLFSLLFIGGSFYPKTKVEDLLYKMTEYAKENGEYKFFCSSESESMLKKQSFSSSFNNRFNGAYPFKTTIGYNLDKELPCNFNDLGESGKNVSFLISDYFTNHLDGDNIVFDRYKLSLMFKYTNAPRASKDINFLYLAQSQADYLITHNETKNTYEDLIGFDILLDIGGDISTWRIANIIKEEGVFYKAAKSSFNNFVLCYIDAPDSLKKTESMQFSFGTNEYQNYNDVKSIKSEFANFNCLFRTRKADSFENSKEFINYFNKVDSMTSAAPSILLLSFSVIGITLLLFVFVKKNTSLKYVISYIASAILSWLVFFIIAKSIKSIMYFSFISLLFFLLIFIVGTFAIFFIWLMDRTNAKNS